MSEQYFKEPTMADTIVSTGSEDNYSFNLEWIAEGSGIGEEICGVDKDCIVVPSSPMMPKIENCDSDYVEIQVTEEEVIAAPWDDNTEWYDQLRLRVPDDKIVSELDVSALTEDVVVPLDEEQDEYSRLHPYPCDFCSRRFAKQSSLTVHMLTHQTQRLHDCNMCGATYRRKLELVEHMKIHSYAPIKEEDIDGLCFVDDTNIFVKEVKKPTRSRKKKKKNETSKHTPAIAPSDMDFFNSITSDIKQEFIEEFEEPDQKFPVIDPARPYVCQFCGVGFAREKALVSHKLVHAGDAAFECDRCNEIFQSQSMLTQHVASKHPRTPKKGSHSRRAVKEEVVTGDYICTLCHLIFSTAEELIRHKDNHDVGSGVHTCTLCRGDFVLLEDLRTHMRESHGTTNACSHCDQVFQDKNALAAHLLTHSAPKGQLTCTVCSRKFTTKVALKRHAATHETKDKSTTSIQCTECGASNFPDGRSLLFHRQNDHGVNMSRLFPCVECGKTFNSRSSQQIHIRIHTGERPYGCRYCWKAFGDGGTLRKHERIHTGEKPYVCPVCSKAFNQRVVLREHVRAHHSGAESRLSESCYECQVCGQYFTSSEDLCAHLVHHSDENTAKHRTPSARKTNIARRRKPPQPIPEPQEDILPPLRHIEDLPPPPVPTPPPPPAPKKKSRSSASNNLDAMVKLGKSTLENLNSINEGKRARIVRSGKKGFHKGQNKRYLNKKEKVKNNKLLSNGGSYASKYAVSQPGLENVVVRESTSDDMMDECANYMGIVGMGSQSNGDDSDGGDGGAVRTRPRTKNVSYHNMKVDHKSYDYATFSDVDLAIQESDFLLPPSPKKKKSCKKKKNKTKPLRTDLEPSSSGDSQYINGITMETDPNDLEQEEQIETSIVSDELEIKTDGTLACQLCNEVFFHSEELFRHIQSHL